MNAWIVTDDAAPSQELPRWRTQIGMALGPGEHEHQVVVASAGGELKYMDFRLTEGNGHLSGQSSGESGSGQLVSSGSGAGAARMGIWKRVQPDDHAPISTFAAHPYAPLLSTFSPHSQASPRLPCMPIKSCHVRLPRASLGSPASVGASTVGINCWLSNVTVVAGPEGMGPEGRLYCDAERDRWWSGPYAAERLHVNGLAPVSAPVCSRRHRQHDAGLRD